jgi:hypothetical protein
VQETILAEELECTLYPIDGRDLSVECAVEAEELSQRVVRISNVLVDKEMLPVQNIHQLPMSARVVMSAVDLVLKRLQEVLVSGSAPSN